jgi:hypothetical protein
VRGQGCAVEQHPGVHDQRAEDDDGRVGAGVEQLDRQQLGRAAEQQRRVAHASRGSRPVEARVAPRASPNGM